MTSNENKPVLVNVACREDKKRVLLDASPAPTPRDEYLFFFFDCESTGLSIYRDRIIEVAAKVHVVDMAVSQPSYSSLVFTSHKISAEVQEMTGITEALIQDESPLSVVFLEFLEWINTITKEVSRASNITYVPVLIAHNGYQFDFPLLLAEIERQKNLGTDLLLKYNIQFADTLPHLRQSKKNEFEELGHVTKFGLKILYSTVLGKTYSAHRALPDVEALEELFTQTALKKLLLSIPIRSTKEQLQLWITQKDIYNQVNKLRVTLPDISREQARKLVKMGLTNKELCHMCATTKTKEEFKELLKMKGVQKGKLHNQLVTRYSELKRNKFGF